MIWACPVCKEPLEIHERQATCSNNHRFDQARQGYFNLMSANRKGSRDPGDSREMMMARREFLQQGHYQPLAAGLADLLARIDAPQPVNLLDSGCGEGYYLNQIKHNQPEKVRGYGLDISKDAIKLAARSDPKVQWVVASGFQLPIVSGSLDVVLRVFAPGSDDEVRRVLAGGGEFWRVAPGANHLQELKACLYNHVQAHSEPASPEGFELIEQQSITTDCELQNPDSVQQLLAMTPFVWQAPKQRQQEVLALKQLDVTADFLVQRYKVIE